MHLTHAVASACLIVASLTVATPSIAQGLGNIDMDRDALPPPAAKPRLPETGVLFFDDFQRDTIGPLWSSDRDEAWSIRQGTLRADLPDKKNVTSLIRAGSVEWTDYAVDLDVCMMRGANKGVVVRVNGDDGMTVDLRGAGYGDVVLRKGSRKMAGKSALNGNARWHHLRVEVRGSTYKVFVDGKSAIEKRDTREALPSGQIALLL
jgi:hypothetical protein